MTRPAVGLCTPLSSATAKYAKRVRLGAARKTAPGAKLALIGPLLA